MKISQIQALVAVAEYGKFSEAALELDLSQPAISHAIATLEEELGVLLFARGRHGAVVTPAGERIVCHARQILDRIEMMYKEANLHKGLHGGQVRIASFRSVATYVLPFVIAKFQQEFPEVSISLIERFSYQDVEQCLHDGKVDIGITYLPTSNNFEAWEILQDEYIALLPPSANLKAPQISWEDLAAYSCVWLPALPCGRNLHESLKILAPTLPVAYDIQEESTIVNMVKQGLGAAILPRLAAEPIPKKIKVYSLPVPLYRTIGVATLAEAFHIPPVFAFLEIFKQFKFPSAIELVSLV
ncbi:MAG: LysR family transcriptional regulator [Hydrococcus sp. Prado102]|jgi:DNA-binding transcriptional LysR family regulator|nr:LysR family transcriptional regulator [Hydrococcus sp. Prado102]